MRRIFLTSSFEDVYHFLPEFLDESLTGKRVTFITTASVVEKMNFFVESGRKSLEKLGLIVDELEITRDPSKDIFRKLEENDYIYVAGGNTFYLLQELKKTATDILIANEINAGKVYIGESAGAVILSPNIEYIEEMDNSTKGKDLVDYDAMGILDIYPLPHYDSYPFQGTAQGIIDRYGDELNLYPFRNKETIWIEGDKITTVDCI